MSRESETCLLKLSNLFFFCLDRQFIFWAPNCIRIVEYEIAKTTVETNVRSLCPSLLFFRVLVLEYRVRRIMGLETTIMAFNSPASPWSAQRPHMKSIDHAIAIQFPRGD